MRRPVAHGPRAIVLLSLIFVPRCACTRATAQTAPPTTIGAPMSEPTATRAVEDEPAGDAPDDSPAASLPTKPGFVQWAQWEHAGPAIESFKGSWIVPAEPSTNSDQIVFLHLALQTRKEQTPPIIFSAAIQWGKGLAGGGSRWTMACYVGAGTELFSSDAIDVQTGDRVDARITRTTHLGVSIWECHMSSPRGTVGLRRGGDVDFGIVFGGILEAYAPTELRCSDYPQSPGDHLRLTEGDGRGR